MKPSKDQIEALRQQFGDVWTIAVDDSEIVIRRPPRAEYKRWQKRTEKGDLSEATEDLARASIVFPEKDEVERLVEGPLPGMLEVAGVEAAKIARGQDGSAKKYVPSSAPALAAPAPTT